MPHDSPLPGGHTLGSDEGSMTLHELTVLCTYLSNKVESLETELKQTKQTYGAAFTKLIKKVKKLEQTVKTSQARRRTKIIASDDEEDLVAEAPSKQGRSMIEELDLDAGISLVPLHVEVQGRYYYTLAETLMEIRKSSAKAKGKAKMDETKSSRKMKQREQVQISRDTEVAQKLQEEFDAAERQRMAQVHQAAQGFTDAEWDDVKEIFETTMRKVQSFMPMGSELEVQRLKRTCQEVLEEAKLLVIVPVEEVYVEALQVKYLIIDWEVYSEDTRRDDLVKLWDLVKERFSTTEPTNDKEKELWVELKRLFEPDNHDTLWKLQRKNSSIGATNTGFGRGNQANEGSQG
ncbi:hypothetical protein Tco_0206303 [Tanacetum coccineum]